MKHFLEKNRRYGKRILSAVVVAALVASMPVWSTIGQGDSGNMLVWATSAEDIKNQAEQNLEDVNQNIDDIEDEQTNIDNKLANAAVELDKLLAAQQQLQSDIENKQDEVEQTNADLLAAREKESEEYESMKLRIQFMYENNTDNSFWTAILSSNGLADMLTRVEYISEVYKADRELMDQYEQTVKDVEDKTILLANEMEELLELQDSYQVQQVAIEGKISELQSQKEQYAEQLEAARAQAAEYEETIRIQGEIIRQQEAAAAAAAAEEERRRQEAAANAANQNGDDSDTVVDPDTYEGGGTGAPGLGSAAYLTDPSADPAFKTDISGEELVAYARQFVGNPYVWGGNSLTNGVDCSGFVHLVYQNFGIDTPRYSQSFKTWGEPVAYQNMKPGDVVVYPGHVAIYIGNGCIVEAQGKKFGITDYRSVNCHTITAIRRGL